MAGERWPEGTPPYSAVWRPAAAVSVLPLGLDTALDWGRQGLTEIYHGFAPRRPALLVAGDEAADFALALAWDRLYGRSAWLPSEWQPDHNVTTSEMTAIRLELGTSASTRVTRTGRSASPRHHSPPRR